MKNIGRDEEVYFEKIDGLKMKLKVNRLTNKKSVYIKNLDRIACLKDIDGIVYSGNWIEFDNKEDCTCKVRLCIAAILLYQANVILKSLEE